MRRLLLLLAVVVAACNGASDAAEPGSSTLSAAAYPVTISDYGRQVTLESRPQRIVSLSATHTEMLYAIGAGELIAGTDLTSNFPAAANDTPKVDAFNFNAEEVLALNPDLVVLAFNFAGEVEAMEAVGVPALLLPPAGDLGEVYRQIAILGAATDNEEAAIAEIEILGSRIEGVVAGYEPPAESLTFFHEVDETLFSTNSNSFLGQLYALFGLINIADEVPDEFGSGFPQLSAEFIIESDPDLIFLGDAAFGVTAETLEQRPGWDEMSAVVNGTIFELDAEISGRWGPRTYLVVQQIHDAVRSLG